MTPSSFLTPIPNLPFLSISSSFSRPLLHPRSTPSPPHLKTPTLADLLLPLLFLLLVAPSPPHICTCTFSSITSSARCSLLLHSPPYSASKLPGSKLQANNTPLQVRFQDPRGGKGADLDPGSRILLHASSKQPSPVSKLPSSQTHLPFKQGWW